MKKFFVVFVIIAMLSNTTFSYAEENYGFEIIETYKIETEPIFVEDYSNNVLYGMDELNTTTFLDTEATYLPSKYNQDINNLKYVSPVKNQLKSGNCWIFSALGAAESYMLKNFPVLDENGTTENDAYDFSENHMQYMVSNRYNNTKYGHNMSLGSGGNYGKALPYFLNRIGLVNERDDEFVWPAKGRDYSETANIPMSDYIITETIFNHEDISEYDGRDYDKKAEIREDLKKAIISYGSAVCALNSSADYFAEPEEKNLYYFPISETAKTVDTNHSVLIVGWDDTYDKENFRHTVDGIEIVPPDNGAFIVKNSWGTDACDNGFFYLSYYDYYVGYELFAITNMEERNEKSILYSYDDFFPHWSMSVVLEDEKENEFLSYTNYYGNQFERKTDNEVLTHISLYAEEGFEYYIYMIDDELKEADENTGYHVYFENLEECMIRFGKLIPENTGYYTVDIEDTQITSEKFSILILAHSPTNQPHNLYFEANATQAGVVYANSEPMQSFYYPNLLGMVGFIDLHKHVEARLGGANFPIKAITKTEEKYTDISFVNFTDENYEEKTTFNKGDTVRIAAVVDGVNLDEETKLICGIYNGNRLVKVLDKPMGNKGNVFTYENIPEDFENCIVKVFAIDGYGNIKPLGNADIKCGREAHAWDSGVTIKQPTHLEYGVKRYICETCEEKKFEQIEKTPEHTYGNWESVDAQNHKKVCACGDEVTEIHNFVNGVCTECGYEEEMEQIEQTEE